MNLQLLPDRFPSYIYGLHEAGGEHLMLEASRPGWVLEMATVGHDPNNVPAGDYTHLVNQGLRVVVRVHHGFGAVGTLPQPELYPAFAQSCATFVARCRGCSIWIIGNEPNHEAERPDGQLILPQHYADAYRRCRAVIHQIDGHQNDQVLVAGPALWNATTTYPENPSGDWVKYFRDILSLLPAGECDGFALHTYTHLHDPSKIQVDIAFPSPGYHHLRDEFRSYRDFMEAIPARFRDLPVYITETDPTERFQGWGEGQNLGWVRTAYQEIAEWNSSPTHQPIQALVLYRWFKAADQPEWSISNRPGIQDDLRQALRAAPESAYRVRLPSQPPVDSDRDRPDVVVSPGYTNQYLITAFYRAGVKLNPQSPWALMAKAGVKLSALTKDRNAVYTGPEIDNLPNLTQDEKRLVRRELAAIYKPSPAAMGIGPAVVAAGESLRGFLRIQSDLAMVPLEPPDPLRLDLATAASGAERRVITAWNRYGWLLVTLADRLELDPGLAVAVTAVEVGSRGFTIDGRMIIRFHNHVFFEKWGQQNREQYERHFHHNPGHPWLEHEWRPAADANWRDCHGTQNNEWAVFEFARSLDDTSAKLSIAMGAPRLMGLLHPIIGYMSVDQMFNDFAAREQSQLIGLFDLLRGPSGETRRMAALRAHDFESFAALHSGIDRAATRSAMLRSAYEAFQRLRPAG